MAIEFMRQRLAFDPTQGRFPQRLGGSVAFSRPVRTVHCAVQGFDVRYVGGDRPLHRLAIDVSDPQVDQQNRAHVTFDVALGLRDASGPTDDAYSGWVDVLAIADTV